MIHESMFGSPLIITELDKGAITSIRFSPTGDRIAVGSSLGCFLLFETGANTPTVDFPPVDGPLNQLCWSPRSPRVYSVTESGSIWVHDTDMLTMDCIYHDPSVAFLSCAVSPDETQVICGTTTGQLEIIYPRRNNAHESIRGHTAAVAAISFDPEGEFFLTSSHDTFARVWSAEKLKCIQTLTYKTPMCDCAFCSDGKMMLIADSSSTVYCLLRETRTLMKMLTIAKEIDTYIVYTGFLGSGPDAWIVVGTSNGYVHMFKDSPYPAHSFRVHDDIVAAVDVHPFLPMLATGGGPDDMSFKLWHKDVTRQTRKESTEADTTESDECPSNNLTWHKPIDL